MKKGFYFHIQNFSFHISHYSDLGRMENRGNDLVRNRFNVAGGRYRVIVQYYELGFGFLFVVQQYFEFKA